MGAAEIFEAVMQHKHFRRTFKGSGERKEFKVGQRNTAVRNVELNRTAA